MRNLKKIIAVVVTLVMLFAITSISASAATAPVFSLRGATEVNFLKEVETEGDPAQYYELAVYLEDAGEQVGAIQGVITYEPEIFTYKDAVLGSALSSDLNSVDNSIKVQYDESEAETGTIKFVGLSEKSGEWFVIRFRITGEEKVGATFALKAYAANKESSASLEVNTKSIASTIVDEELINMEGGAILQKTHGLSSEKHVVDGTLYEGNGTVVNATVAAPKAAIANKNLTTKIDTDGDSVKETTVTIGALSASDRTLVGLNAPIYQFVRSDDDRVSEWAFSYNAINYESSNIQLNAGADSIFFYVELPEGDEEVYLGATFGMYNTADVMKNLAVTHNIPVYLMWEGENEWVEYRSVQADMYNVPLPQGFKGLVRIDHSALKAVDFSLARVNLYLRSLDVNTTAYMSLPWLAYDFDAATCEAWYFASHEKASEPTQELTFDVKVDAQMLALKEATLKSEVVEVGTLFMYTKRLAYRELTLDMTDKTGLAKASRVLEDDETLESFTVNLKNIRWDAMGVSVSARAYIKFKDGTVIYSRNYHNEFETNAGYARESVIGVALDAIDAGHYDTVLAAKYGYDVDNINSIATDALSTHKLTGDDRILLLNFIADCYEASAAE